MSESRAASARNFVRELIADFVELPTEKIGLDADIFDVYGIESLQLVELMTAVEGRLGAHLEFDDFRAARTVIEISDLVLSRVAEGDSSSGK
jgi:acyl carrier protein